MDWLLEKEGCEPTIQAVKAPRSAHARDPALTWLDTSEKDRCRTLAFIDTFRKRDTRDELGTGVVCDAFFDLMFPGTSTVQTRATYFLLVPWCYVKAEAYARRTSAARDTLDTYTRDREVGLIKPAPSGPPTPVNSRSGTGWGVADVGLWLH